MITWGGIFEKNEIENKISEFNNSIERENFWKDKLFAQKILKEKSFLENIINSFNLTENGLENLELLLDLALKENDSLVIKDCEKKLILYLLKLRKLKSLVFYQMKMTT